MNQEEGKAKIFYNKHKSKFSFGITIIICLIIAKLITTFVFTSSLVDGDSMRPTLENGDKGLSDALFFRLTGVKRFDIVVIEVGGQLLVKRIIALPNERIQYNNGVLRINGEIIEEEFIPESYAKQTKVIDKTMLDDQYFVLGDNRGNSADSRSFGAINKSQIKSRGLMIFSKCRSSEGGTCSGLRLVWPYFA